MSEIPCVIYAAKSTKDRHLSIPEQLDDCREMAGENDWEILGEFKDEGFTAFTGNRGPGLAAATDLAKRSATERGCEVMLVAQHTSRFARGDGARPEAPKALVELWHEWARANVRGRLVENDYAMASSVAAATQGEADHSESKRKSKSIKKGLGRRARDRGKIAGGSHPYAYRWVDGALEVVPNEVPVVARIFEQYLAGRSQGAIARDLNRDGIRAATGGKWAQVSVRHVLTKPLYVGKIKHGSEVYPGAHDAVVSEETWQAAQVINAASVAKRATQNTKGNYRGSAPGSNNGGGRYPDGHHLFTKGLLRCGTCGDSMSPRTDRRASGPPAETYVCNGRGKDPNSCSQRPVRRVVIDEAMVLELDKRYLDLAATRDRLKASRTADAALAAQALAAAEADALKAAERLGRVQRAFQDGFIEAADYAEQRATLLTEREAADAAVTRTQARSAAVDDEDVTDELLDRLRDLRAAVLGGLDRAPDLNALRKLLRGMFESVVYWPAEGWTEALVIPGTDAGCNVGPHAYAGSAVLVPILRRDAIAGYDGDPLSTNPLIRRATLDIPAGVSDSLTKIREWPAASSWTRSGASTGS